MLFIFLTINLILEINGMINVDVRGFTVQTLGNLNSRQMYSVVIIIITIIWLH